MKDVIKIKLIKCIYKEINSEKEKIGYINKHVYDKIDELKFISFVPIDLNNNYDDEKLKTILEKEYNNNQINTRMIKEIKRIPDTEIEIKIEIDYENF